MHASKQGCVHTRSLLLIYHYVMSFVFSFCLGTRVGCVILSFQARLHLFFPAARLSPGESVQRMVFQQRVYATIKFSQKLGKTR